MCLTPPPVRPSAVLFSGLVEAEEEIATELIHVGDVLKVLPGAAVPTDGVVVLGRSAVDEAMITGK